MASAPDPVVLDTPAIKQRVEFSRGLRLPEIRDADKTLFVFDRNTRALFAESPSAEVVIADGETAKSWESVEAILTAALEHGLTRRSVVAGVGGGVIGDLTAFAASIYMRGCAVVLTPTTLLAMVDAAIGGKTGINFGGYKNMVGTFFPATHVLVCIDALKTLPSREYHSGLAEVIKTAALGDAELFDLLERRERDVRDREPEVMGEVVRRCVQVKAAIVEADLTERGQRAWLNLGHTFAHALESVTGFGRYTHGEAVAWGMGRALDLGLRLGITEAAYARRLGDLIRRYEFDMELAGLESEALIGAMSRDKKRQSDRLRFVLQADLCRTQVVEVDTGDVRAILP
jgi:3-dehydroquinate synthase